MPTTTAAEIFRQSFVQLNPDQERGWVLPDRKGQRSEWNLAERQWKVSNIFVIQTWRLNLADLIGIPGLEVALWSIPPGILSSLLIPLVFRVCSFQFRKSELPLFDKGTRAIRKSCIFIWGALSICLHHQIGSQS